MSSDETIYTCAPPFIPTVQISGDGGRALFTIHPNGTVEGEIEDASEAARLFVEHVRGIVAQPIQSDAEITEADCNVAEYIAGDRARDLDYQVVAYHRKWSVLEERAKIVAWLMREEDDYPSGKYSGFAAIIREEIEAGEHLK